MSHRARFLAVIAVVVAGCSSKPAPQYPQADFDAPANWPSITVAQFEKQCPDFVKALKAGQVQTPDPPAPILVANEGMQHFKVRIENGVIKEAWRERLAD